MTHGWRRATLASMRSTRPAPFLDRVDAGRQLAGRLDGLTDERPIVVALPRGGVPVAAQVAAALRAPLQLLEVRKLGAPANPECAIGAIAEDGTIVLRHGLEAATGLTPAQLQAIVDRERIELRRRTDAYRSAQHPVDVRGRTVILVDDGIATGLTVVAAVRAVRRQGAQRILVAAPVASAEAFALLQDEADEVICHTVSPHLRSVGEWYRDFEQVTDDEVRQALQVDGHHPLGQALAHPVEIAADGVSLHGDLVRPPDACGLVVFAHGSGSGRHSPRNRAVAETLQRAGLATLLLDLLTGPEERDRANVFDIPLLTRRMEHATRWALADPRTDQLPIGYFGASTGAAAALRAAAVVHDIVRAIVCRGGRVDLAADRLAAVTAPTLLLVGSDDGDVLALNRRAAAQLGGPHRISVIQGAGHLFEEPGTLDTVATLAADWFKRYLSPATSPVALAGGTA
jgi:predicted phosphoribosyltransferase/dienelactone hydrolase